LPFGNKDEAFSTLTADDDIATNDILSLDRGQYVPANKYDNHEYMIKALIHRMRKSDFKTMPVEVQQMYEMRLNEHQTSIRNQIMEKQRADFGMIPSGGFLVTVNASWFNPANNRVERIKIPSDSVMFMVNKLQEQGVYAQMLQNLPPQAQVDIATPMPPQAQVDIATPMNQSQQLTAPPQVGPQNLTVPQAQ